MVKTHLEQLIHQGNIWAKAHPKKIVFVLLLIFTGYHATNPAEFVNLWLTRDQQAARLFEQGKYQEAADTFLDQRWRAYSLYAAGDFEGAAASYQLFDTADGLFAQANAMAHAEQYKEAHQTYDLVIAIDPEHMGARTNKATVELIIYQLEHMAEQSTGGEPGSDEDSRDKTKRDPSNFSEDEELPERRYAENLSTNMWLEQVQKNPAFFLRKKFAMQHEKRRDEARKPVLSAGEQE